MHESEIWITRIFNDHLAGLGNALLNLGNSALNLLGIHSGLHAEARPWANFITMQILVALILVVVFALLRPRFSADRPGRFQHTFELIYEFVNGQADEQVGHEAAPYLAFFGTIFIFILASNLIGIVPGFESPTMNPAVPFGCALATFGYYNMAGISVHGFFRYVRNFAGPMIWLAPLMIPIELIGHLARPLSLGLRLFGNITGDHLVTAIFFGLVPLLVPLPVMFLGLFVAFVQTFVFTLLSMAYFSGAIAHEEH